MIKCDEVRNARQSNKHTPRFHVDVITNIYFTVRPYSIKSIDDDFEIHISPRIARVTIYHL